MLGFTVDWCSYRFSRRSTTQDTSFFMDMYTAFSSPAASSSSGFVYCVSFTALYSSRSSDLSRYNSRNTCLCSFSVLAFQDSDLPVFLFFFSSALRSTEDRFLLFSNKFSAFLIFGNQALMFFENERFSDIKNSNAFYYRNIQVWFCQSDCLVLINFFVIWNYKWQKPSPLSQQVFHNWVCRKRWFFLPYLYSREIHFPTIS